MMELGKRRSMRERGRYTKGLMYLRVYTYTLYHARHRH